MFGVLADPIADTWSPNLPPVALLSYSYDSEDHKAWVRKLATDLRKQYGIDVLLDVWEVPLGGDVSIFMQQGISRSDRVLMICTETYIAKANGGTGGGVPYEMMIVRKAIVELIDTIKFIPVIRNQLGEIKMPDGIGQRMAVDFRDDGRYPAKLEELARAIYGLSEKPALGTNPFGS
jgi:hypothetical protein